MGSFLAAPCRWKRRISRNNRVWKTINDIDGAPVSSEAWLALVTLTALEVVLGIDNIIFIRILAAKLASDQQVRARFLGFAVPTGTRIALLLSQASIMRLTAPLFSLLRKEISGRDLILFLGGIFLFWKATREIHERLEGRVKDHIAAREAAPFGSVLIPIARLDIVFSLDSVTAVGIANEIRAYLTDAPLCGQ